MMLGKRKGEREDVEGDKRKTKQNFEGSAGLTLTNTNTTITNTV